MVNVTRNWIKENVEKLYAFGGQVNKDNFEEYVIGKGSLQSTLTRKGVFATEACERTEKFHILLPGIGWADCFPFRNEMKRLGGEE